MALAATKSRIDQAHNGTTIAGKFPIFHSIIHFPFEYQIPPAKPIFTLFEDCLFYARFLVVTDHKYKVFLNIVWYIVEETFKLAFHYVLRAALFVTPLILVMYFIVECCGLDSTGEPGLRTKENSTGKGKIEAD